MKKNRLAVILTIVLVAVAGLLIWNNRYLTTIRGAAADFAVWDTASVTKIFLVDRFDHESLLERHEDGWTVNHDYKAHDVKVNNLLTTMFKVHVRMPVSVASHDNVIKDLAVNGTKVGTMNKMYSLLVSYKSGDVIHITYLRDGMEREADVVLMTSAELEALGE